MRVQIEGRQLILTIDLDNVAGHTSNGNISIASTHGWLKIEEGVSLSLNLVKKVKANS
jgi:hypothetical protein